MCALVPCLGNVATTNMYYVVCISTRKMELVHVGPNHFGVEGEQAINQTRVEDFETMCQIHAIQILKRDVGSSNHTPVTEIDEHNFVPCIFFVSTQCVSPHGRRCFRTNDTESQRVVRNHTTLTPWLENHVSFPLRREVRGQTEPMGVRTNKRVLEPAISKPSVPMQQNDFIVGHCRRWMGGGGRGTTDRHHDRDDQGQDDIQGNDAPQWPIVSIQTIRTATQERPII